MLNDISESSMFVLGALFVLCCSFLIWRFLAHTDDRAYRERELWKHCRDLRVLVQYLQNELEERKRQRPEPNGLEPSDPPILPRMEPTLHDVKANGKGDYKL